MNLRLLIIEVWVLTCCNWRKVFWTNRVRQRLACKRGFVRVETQLLGVVLELFIILSYLPWQCTWSILEINVMICKHDMLGKVFQLRILSQFWELKLCLDGGLPFLFGPTCLKRISVHVKCVVWVYQPSCLQVGRRFLLLCGWWLSIKGLVSLRYETIFLLIHLVLWKLTLSMLKPVHRSCRLGCGQNVKLLFWGLLLLFLLIGSKSLVLGCQCD